MNLEAAKFFKKDEKSDCILFMGDKLEVFIPIRYKNENFLILGDKIQALGFLALTINEKIKAQLCLPALIEMDPVETYETSIGDDKYFVAVLHKGNQFMTSTRVMQNDRVGYLSWREFLSVGHMPPHITYENVHNLYDHLGQITGKGIPVDHAIVEIIYAHIYRNQDNMQQFYRHSKMNKPPVLTTLKSVAYGPDSTLSRVAGSYSQDGLVSAMLHPEDAPSELEEIFRS